MIKIKIPPIIDIKDDLLRRLVLLVAMPIAMILVVILTVGIAVVETTKSEWPSVLKSFRESWKGR